MRSPEKRILKKKETGKVVFEDECHLHSESQYTMPKKLVQTKRADYFDKVRLAVFPPGVSAQRRSDVPDIF